MARKVLLIPAVCALLMLAAQSDKSYHAERFDVDVVIQPDRSLMVEETVTFRFVGGPFSYVFREIPTERTDGIVDITAGADGVAWPHGDGPGEVEIKGGDPVEVIWHLSPTADTTQTFTLAYRALGVVARTDEADVLEWQALPDEYDYAIDDSRVRFAFPPGGTLAGEPEFMAGTATVSATANGATFDMQSLSPGDPLVARLSFVPGAFTGAPPVWLTQQEAQNSFAWIWFVVGAVILIGGLAVFYRATSRYARTLPKAHSYVYKPPIDLSPALAGYLANQTIGWNQGLATLFDLAGRGFVEIEQISEKTTFRAPECAVTLLNRPDAPRPHEQALVDLLFTDKHGNEQEVVTMAEMGRLITSSRWKAYTDTLKEEADGEGFLNPAAKRQQKRVVAWSVVILLIAFVLFVLAFLFESMFGFWPLVTVGAVLVLGFLGMIFGAAISPLSEKGYQYASSFEPFRKLLNDVAKGKAELPDLAYYEAYLPYATAYGIAEPWVKGQAKAGYDIIPGYFRAAESGAMHMASYVAVISAASHSGGAAGAAAGAAGAAGAAAGGGASGAG